MRFITDLFKLIFGEFYTIPYIIAIIHLNIIVLIMLVKLFLKNASKLNRYIVALLFAITPFCYYESIVLGMVPDNLDLYQQIALIILTLTLFFVSICISFVTLIQDLLKRR